MIRTKTLTKIKELEMLPKLEGIECVRYTTDGSYDHIRSLTIKDKNGMEIEISGADCSNRIVFIIPAPPEKIPKYKLSGMIVNVPFEKLFSDEAEAETTKSEIIMKDTEKLISDIKLEKVEIILA